jgi:mRNA-degrading endonuclease HigB of HigAB toxin-antitoxin module
VRPLWDGGPCLAAVDIKAAHGSANFLANIRVVFNIAGNEYRRSSPESTRRRSCSSGTYAQYDAIDAEEI